MSRLVIFALVVCLGFVGSGCIAIVTDGEPVHAGFVVTGVPPTVSTGVPVNFVVTIRAVDNGGHAYTTYTGLVTFESSDPAAVLPPNVVFTAGDAGERTLAVSVTWNTLGSQTLVVRDSADAQLTGSAATLVQTPHSATSLEISGPTPPVIVGAPQTITITARDSGGGIATDYNGTVRFTISGSSITPGDYTFQPADNGVHTFVDHFSFNATGNQTVTVWDIAQPALTDSVVVNVLSASSAVSLELTGLSSPVYVGVSQTITVTARDTGGAIATDYVGTVRFTVTGSTSAPADYTFQPSDNGVHTFVDLFAFSTPGNQFVTVADVVEPALADIVGVTVLAVSSAVTLEITDLPAQVYRNTPDSFTVTARDGTGAIATDYRGTIRLRSSDGSWQPGDYVFTPADAGTRTFVNFVDWSSSGPATLTVTDVADPLLTDTAMTTVVSLPTAPQMSYFDVYGLPAATMTGVPHSFRVVARRSNGDVCDNYRGTVRFLSSDPAAALPPSFTFQSSDAGVADFAATLNTAGNRQIDVNDQAAGETETVPVDVFAAPAPPAAVRLEITTLPSVLTEGVFYDVTVTAYDRLGAVATGYTGTIDFDDITTSPLYAPGPYTFTTGDAGTHTLTSAIAFAHTGFDVLTVYDVAAPQINGNQFVDIVGGVDSFLISGLPSTVIAGQAYSLTVTALDASAQPITDYLGTVEFGMNDLAGTEPAPYTFQPSDMGTATISGAIWRTVGSFWIRVEDSIVSGFTYAYVDVDPGPVDHLWLTGVTPGQPTVGAAYTMRLQARDQFYNVVPGYTGTVTFSTSDPGATIPANYAFQPADMGERLFDFTFSVTGQVFITVTDVATPSVLYDGWVTVLAAVPTGLVIVDQPTTTAAGDVIAPAIRVEVRNTVGGIATGATNPVRLAISNNVGGSDIAGTLMATPVSGVVTFSDVRLFRPGTGYTLTVTALGVTPDTSDPFDITASGSIAPDVVSASIPVGPVRGVVTITYALQQIAGERVDVRVEYDPDGTGTFFPCSAGPSPMGFGGIHGVSTAQPPSSAPHIFVWNASRDMPNINSNSAQLRVRATLDGLSGLTQTITGVQVHNGSTFPTNTSAAFAPMHGVAQGDMDRDGTTDAVVVQQAAGAIAVIPISSTGAFGPPIATTVGASPSDVVVADFNRDGILDFACTNAGANTVSAATGLGTGAFNTPSSIAVGAMPASLAVGDFDNDGNDDLAIADEGSNTITILLNTTPRGASTPTWSPGPVLPVDAGPIAVVVGDFDRDAFADIAVTHSATATVRVALNDRAGGFITGAAITIPAVATHMITADLDRNGALDLAIACPSIDEIARLNGDGNGGFSGSGSVAATTPTRVGVHDVNQDGRPDLLAISATAGEVRFWRATALGAFGAPLTLPLAGAPSGLAVWDIDRSGSPDLVTVDTTGTIAAQLNAQASLTDPRLTSPFDVHARFFSTTGDPNGDGCIDTLVVGYANGDYQLRWLLNDGTGRFVQQSDSPIGSQVAGVAFGDFDVDGHLDAAVAYLSQVKVYRGSAGLSFTLVRTLSASNNLEGAEVADFNGDRIPDIIAGAQNSGSLHVYIGRGDFTFPNTTTLASTRARAIVTGDFDGDGDTDAITASAASVLFLANDGGGNFTSTALTGFGSDCRALAAGYLNNDAHIDLVLAMYGSNTVRVAFGDGTGAFPTSVPLGGVQPAEVGVVDWNLDGHDDVVAIMDQSIPDETRVFVNDGTGLLYSIQAIDTGGQVHALALFDATNDGCPDAIHSMTVEGAAMSFVKPVKIDTDDDPAGIAIGDFNRDGALDAAVAVQFPGTNGVRIVHGDGSGGITVATTLPLPVEPNCIATADLNLDGHLDFLVGGPGGNDALQIILADGAGGYLTAIAHFFTYDVTEIRVGEFTGDGQADWLVRASSTYHLATNTTVPGTMSAAFTQSSAAVGTNPNAMLGDFDRNGTLDFITPWFSGSRLFANDGTGAFTETPIIGLSTSVNGVGDYDRNGWLDIAHADSSNLNITRGTGLGTFATTSVPWVNYGPFADAHDLDRDGRLDVLGRYVVAFGDGLGGVLRLVSAYHTYDGGATTVHAFADFDRDGRLDMFATPYDDIVLYRHR